VACALQSILFATVADSEVTLDLRAQIDRLAAQCAESRASYQRLLASARLVMAEAEARLASSPDKLARPMDRTALGSPQTGPELFNAVSQPIRTGSLQG